MVWENFEGPWHWDPVPEELGTVSKLCSARHCRLWTTALRRPRLGLPEVWEWELLCGSFWSVGC